jgi:thioredoxin 1
MKSLALWPTLVMSAALCAAEPMLKATPFAVVAQQIGKGKNVLLEVGSDSCRSCQKMGRLLYQVKQAHPAYPIYFVDVRHEREAAYRLKIQMIPTQLVFDGRGREIYRHIGMLSPKELETLLQRYLGH